VTFCWSMGGTAAKPATVHVAAQDFLLRSGTAPKECHDGRFRSADLDEGTTPDYWAGKCFVLLIRGPAWMKHTLQRVMGQLGLHLLHWTTQIEHITLSNG
jgi:hypothetical protein